MTKEAKNLLTKLQTISSTTKSGPLATTAGKIVLLERMNAVRVAMGEKPIAPTRIPGKITDTQLLEAKEELKTALNRTSAMSKPDTQASIKYFSEIIDEPLVVGMFEPFSRPIAMRPIPRGSGWWGNSMGHRRAALTKMLSKRRNERLKR